MIAFKLLYSSYKTKVSFKRHKTVPTIFTSLLLLFSLMPNELMLHLTHTLLGTETIWIWYSYLPILLVLLIFFVAINLVFINFKGSAVTCPTTWTVTFFFIFRVLLFQGKKILKINKSLEVNWNLLYVANKHNFKQFSNSCSFKRKISFKRHKTVPTIDQFRYIEIQLRTIEFLLGWILVYRNWSIYTSLPLLPFLILHIFN